jgi:hypothetical protein
VVGGGSRPLTRLTTPTAQGLPAWHAVGLDKNPVRCVYFVLDGGPPSFTPDVTCPALLKHRSHTSAPAPTRLSRSVAPRSRRLRIDTEENGGRRQPSGDQAYNPHDARPAGLARRGFGHRPVRSPLLRAYFLFLGVREMFQVPRCPPLHQEAVTTRSGWVAPFGDRGINARSQLPHAYRSNATSFIGTQRRGIPRLLIVSSLETHSAVKIKPVGHRPTSTTVSRLVRYQSDE